MSMMRKSVTCFAGALISHTRPQLWERPFTCAAHLAVPQVSKRSRCGSTSFNEAGASLSMCKSSDMVCWRTLLIGNTQSFNPKSVANSALEICSYHPRYEPIDAFCGTIGQIQPPRFLRVGLKPAEASPHHVADLLRQT